MDMHKNGETTNPIIADGDAFSDEQILSLSTSKPHTFSQDLDHQSGAIKYEPVFVIEQVKQFFKPAWQVRMALHKKGQAAPLRFIPFDEERPCDATGTAAALLHSLKLRERYEDDISHYLNHLEEQDIYWYVRSMRDGYNRVTVKPVDSVAVGFDLYDVNSGAPIFVPHIEIFYEKGTKSRSDIQVGNCVYNGSSLVIIYNDGLLLYCRDGETVNNLLITLLQTKRYYNAADIELLKNEQQAGNESGVVIDFSCRTLKLVSPVPQPRLDLREEETGLSIKFFFTYKAKQVAPDESGKYIYLERSGDIYTVASRNGAYERKVLNWFISQFEEKLAVFQPEAERIPGQLPARFWYEGELLQFLVELGKQIIDFGITMRIISTGQVLSRKGGHLDIVVATGINWLDISFQYVDKSGAGEPVKIDRQLIKGGIIGRAGGFTILSSEELEKITLLLEEGKLVAGKVQLPRNRMFLLEEMTDSIVNREERDVQNLCTIMDRLKNVGTIRDHTLPRGFNGTLRSYQQAGYNWLMFLKSCRLNGCLADDMGLGKTVQCLVLLQRIKEEQPGSTSLVVVPVSTMFNWASEIKRFVPDITFLLHYGPSRTKDISQIMRHDVILVSYHTLRNDIELFSRENYCYLILDEAQNIKNRKSQSFKTVRTLESDYRLSMTGTPIENNTLELWAQMDFLNPGLLGSAEQFKRQFARPIESEQDTAAVNRLKKLIFPFILRRRKGDVLSELPQKTETILYNEMNEQQSELYHTCREQYQLSIGKKIKDDGIEKSYIAIFEALMRLRQIALLPALVDKRYVSIPSSKFDQLLLMLREVVAEDHKILVFSQFVQSLVIIREALQKDGIEPAFLDGSMSGKKRQQEINRFQDDPDTRIFLLSLKAGGVGINLTAADYVFIFDPWWNPAIESQAIDRSHRMGQTRSVFAYRMITRQTIEEKILELQNRKRELMSDLIVAEENIFKSCNREEILTLFS